VSAVVEAAVAAARVNAVAVRWVWWVRLHRRVAENGQREQRKRDGGEEQQRHVGKRAAAAPP
jgi:hypothetical protein